MAAVANVLQLIGSWRAAGGEDPDAASEELNRLEAALRDTREQMRQLLAHLDSNDTDAEQLSAKWTLYKDGIAHLESRIAALRVRGVIENEGTIRCEIDLETSEWPYEVTRDTCPEMRRVYDLISNAGESHTPLVSKFVLSLEPALPDPSTNPANSALKNVLVYRIPYIGHYTLRAGPEGGPVVASGRIVVPQRGVFGQLQIGTGGFGRLVSDLELHPATGGLKKVTRVREASAAEVVATDLEAVAAAIEATTSRPTELERIQAENELLEARIENLELLEALAESVDDDSPE